MIDITHGIAPTNVLQGALVLANTLPYMPVGVHLAVVDPGVGGDRKPLGLRGGDGRLYVGSNAFDLGIVYRVTGWEDPARAKVASIGPLLIGFPEALAVRGDVFYRMSDTGGAPSFMKKFRCPGR